MSRLAACSLAAVLAAGCGKSSKQAAPEVIGLAAVPASAQVVVVADVARIAASPLVTRAVETLLLKNAELATRWQRLQDSCKLDINRIKSIVLAVGPAQGQQVGTGPVIMVATGQIAESELAACVRAMVGQGGGTLTAKPLDGRTLYQAKDGNRTMFFAFGRADTVVLGANEAYVTEALGKGPKAATNADLQKWLKLVDQKAPAWAAGRLDERYRGGLVKVTGGQLSAGPAAIVMSSDLSDGIKLDVGAVMPSAADAKALESFGKTHLGLFAMAAQAKCVGPVVDKIAISSENDVTRFKANLTMPDVNLLISALDGGCPTEQLSPPPKAPAGSAAGSAGSAAP